MVGLIINHKCFSSEYRTKLAKCSILLKEKTSCLCVEIGLITQWFNTSLSAGQVLGSIPRPFNSTQCCQWLANHHRYDVSSELIAQARRSLFGVKPLVYLRFDLTSYVLEVCRLQVEVRFFLVPPYALLIIATLTNTLTRFY